MRCWVLLMVGVCSLPTVAAAQASPGATGADTPPAVVVPPVADGGDSTADDLEARNLFAAGQSAFEAGRYDRALEHFERAYALSHRSGLLFNIGVAADRLRHDARALEAFEAYLAAGPSEELRTQVEARVEVLRRLEAERNAVGAAPVTPPPPPSGPDPTGAIVLIVVGATVAVGGAVLAGVAASEDAAVQASPVGSSWREYSGRHDAAETLAITAGVAMGVGAAVAIVGALVWPSGQEDESSAGLHVRDGGIAWLF